MKQIILGMNKLQRTPATVVPFPAVRSFQLVQHELISIYNNLAYGDGAAERDLIRAVRRRRLRLKRLGVPSELIERDVRELEQAFGLNGEAHPRTV